MMKELPIHNTPKSVVVSDAGTGKYVKVLLKEKVQDKVNQ